MQAIKFKMTGTCPLMLNSTASIDPVGKWAKELKVYTSKRTKTDDDHAEMSRIKWFAALAGYLSDGRVCVAPSMVFASIQEGAKLTKRGRHIERGVQLDISSDIHLQYDGPKDIEKLWEKKKFVDIRPVGVNGSKIMQTRAIFHEWSAECSLFVNEQIIDAEEVKEIIQSAGRFCGIGTYRKFFGRFDVEFKS